MKPPHWALRFFQWFCNDHLNDAVLGDLIELHSRRLQTQGKVMADILFICSVISFLQPFALTRKSRSNNLNHIYMFKHNLKIAFRNLARNKSYASLNIAGLVVGMVSSILILLWVQDELSYDDFHPQARQTFRLTAYAGDFNAAVTPAGMPAGLQADLPEITKAVRVSKPRTGLLEVGDKKFEEQRIFYADSNFLEVFHFQLIEGNPNTALESPKGIVITRSMALKYFDRVSSVLGETLRKDNEDNYVITGVLEDIPGNSHLQFDFIFPMADLARHNNDLRNNVWHNFNFYSYLVANQILPAEQDREELEGKINEVFASRAPDIPVKFKLQPLTDIHLFSNLQIDLPGHGNIQYVKIFLWVAIFIMIVACINFMNLATARSVRRAKEVGLRKVVGARRKQLIVQFLYESIAVAVLSLAIALIVVFTIAPLYGQLVDKKLTLDLLNSQVIMVLLAATLLTGILSGSYPAFFLSGFKPVKVLQGKIRIARANTWFRNGLVVSQFVVSILMLVGTVVIYNQLHFIKNKDLGFNRSNLLYVPMSGDVWQHQDALKNKLEENPLTAEYSIVSEIPTNIIQGTLDVFWDGKDPDLQVVVPSINVDEQFIDVFQMRLVKGRNFSDNYHRDSASFIINEEMMRVMELNPDNVVGQDLDFSGVQGKVIGLVRDFNFKPLQYAIEPMVLCYRPYGAATVLRLDPENSQEATSYLEEVYADINPAHPFSYGYIDQDLNNHYQDEEKMGSIFNLFSLLAIFISCIGLYGLSAFIVEQCTKEVGIRKVLGATVLSLVRLLTKDFIRLILVALLIAAPLSWYFMDGWLQDFAYRIQISWWIYIVAGIGAVLFTLVTISHQVIRAALNNPVNSLRSE